MTKPQNLAFFCSIDYAPIKNVFTPRNDVTKTQLLVKIAANGAWVLLKISKNFDKPACRRVSLQLDCRNISHNYLDKHSRIST